MFCKVSGLANECHLKFNGKSIPSIPDLSVTVKGVEKLLQDPIVWSKAMGPDQIPNIILKTCAKELAPAIAEIFQRSINSGTLPEDWRNANISPVFKQEANVVHQILVEDH